MIGKEQMKRQEVMALRGDEDTTQELVLKKKVSDFYFKLGNSRNVHIGLKKEFGVPKLLCSSK